MPLFQATYPSSPSPPILHLPRPVATFHPPSGELRWPSISWARSLAGSCRACAYRCDILLLLLLLLLLEVLRFEVLLADFTPPPNELLLLHGEPPGAMLGRPQALLLLLSGEGMRLLRQEENRHQQQQELDAQLKAPLAETWSHALLMRMLTCMQVHGAAGGSLWIQAASGPQGLHLSCAC